VTSGLVWNLARSDPCARNKILCRFSPILMVKDEIDQQ
jgi:hypothetical protein